MSPKQTKTKPLITTINTSLDKLSQQACLQLSTDYYITLPPPLRSNTVQINPLHLHLTHPVP